MSETEQQRFDTDTNAKLLQELKCYQAELEIRNENLREVQLALEESNKRYRDLYDFAPVAYLTLSEKGFIKEINLTGSALLGLDREKLLQQRFESFVSPKDLERWHLFFAQQIEQGIPQSIDLALKPICGIQRYVKVDCLLMLDEGSLILRITLTDITALKQAELIRYDNDAYQNILATAFDGFLIISADGSRLIDANERYCQLSGYSLEELRSMRLYDLKNPEDFPEVSSRIEKTIANGKAYFETLHRRKDGTLWPVEANTLYRNVNGKGIFYAFLRDISQRKALEESIEESRNLLRTIIDTVPMRIFWKDSHSRYLGCNMAFAQDANMSCPDNLIGKDDFQLLDAEYAKTFQADDKAIIESGVAKLSYDEFVELQDMKAFWVRISKAPLKNQSGETIGVLGIYENITERKRVEQQLQESEHKLATIFDILDVGISMTDEKGNLIDCNKRAESILGLSREQILQRNYAGKEWLIIRPDFTLMPPEEYASVRALTTNRTINCVELGVVKPEGDIVWLLVSATPLRLKGYGVVVTYIDITELKQQQEAIKTSENRFRSIIEISPVPMALNDNQQNITFLNPAFIQIFGYNLADIPTLEDWWDKAYPDPGYRCWAQTTWQTSLIEAESRNQKNFTPVELVIRCKNGAEKTVLATASALSNTFLDEHLVVLYDISAQKQAETLLLKEREQLANEVSSSQEQLEQIKSESDKISTALDVVLNRRATDPNNEKNKLSLEMNMVILPLFKKAKALCSDKNLLNLIEILESQLQQLSKFYGGDASTLANDYPQLTATEIQVALLIKQGLATKIIASMLNISPDTVSTHRKHIRKKLNLDGNSSHNLHNHLIALLNHKNID